MTLLEDAQALLREKPSSERMRAMAEMFPHLVEELRKPPIGFEQLEQAKHSLADALQVLFGALVHVREKFGQDPAYDALFVEVEKPWREVSRLIEALLRMSR